VVTGRRILGLVAHRVTTRPVSVGNDVTLEAEVSLPDRARGVVMFAHGSGSSRHSPRNRQVARALQDRGLATVLLDLLTEDEDRVDSRDGSYRFDIPLLAHRLSGAAGWVGRQPVLGTLPLGLFGASTGAAAALIAAAGSRAVRAVVSRGGRVDLAGEALGAVSCPVLLLVGARDEVVLRLNQRALAALPRADLVVVPGATHLFEEPGALEQVADHAATWFATHLVAPAE